MSIDNFETVSFRVRKSDFAEFKRIANVLFTSGKIKEPKVSILSKTFLYVMANQFRNLETQAQAIINEAKSQPNMQMASAFGGPQ